MKDFSSVWHYPAPPEKQGLPRDLSAATTSAHRHRSLSRNNLGNTAGSAALSIPCSPPDPITEVALPKRVKDCALQDQSRSASVGSVPCGFAGTAAFKRHQLFYHKTQFLIPNPNTKNHQKLIQRPLYGCMQSSGVPGHYGDTDVWFEGNSYCFMENHFPPLLHPAQGTGCARQVLTAPLNAYSTHTLHYCKAWGTKEIKLKVLKCLIQTQTNQTTYTPTLFPSIKYGPEVYRSNITEGYCNCSKPRY